MRFRTKPVEIEAFLYDGTNGDAVVYWAKNVSEGHGTWLAYTREDSKHLLEIHTLEGVMTASAGDWIICGLNGEFYPCKSDVFHKKYEEVGWRE